MLSSACLGIRSDVSVLEPAWLGIGVYSREDLAQIDKNALANLPKVESCGGCTAEEFCLGLQRYRVYPSMRVPALERD